MRFFEQHIPSRFFGIPNLVIFGLSFAGMLAADGQEAGDGVLESIRQARGALESVSAEVKLQALFSHAPNYRADYRFFIHRDGKGDRYACRGRIDHINTETGGPFYDYANEGGAPNVIQVDSAGTQRRFAVLIAACACLSALCFVLFWHFRPARQK